MSSSDGIASAVKIGSPVDQVGPVVVDTSFNERGVDKAKGDPGIMSKVTDISKKALSFFGLDKTFIAKFAVALAKTAVPALLVAGTIFAASFVLSPLALSATIGVIFLVGIAIAAAKLSMMRDTLDKMGKCHEEVIKSSEEMLSQNTKLEGQVKAEQQTVQEQKGQIKSLETSLESAQKNASDAASKLEDTGKSLTEAKTQHEQLMQASAQAHQAEIAELSSKHATEIQTKETEIAAIRAESAAQQEYINKCHASITCIFQSQDQLITSLNQRLQEQSETLQSVLKNIQDLANGEKKLNGALSWAQGKISEAQSKITQVINSAAELTNPAAVKELIESGKFTEKARAMQEASQSAFDIMGELNTGLNDKIIEAQKAIAASREKAKNDCASLGRQVAKAKGEVEAHSAELEKQKATIAELKKEKEAKIAELEKLYQTKRESLIADAKRQAQEFKEKKELEAANLKEQIASRETSIKSLEEKLAASKGSLSNAQKSLEESLTTRNTLEETNAKLVEQLEASETTVAEQKKTIYEQVTLLKEQGTHIATLKGQLASSGGLSLTGGVKAAVTGLFTAGAVLITGGAALPAVAAGFTACASSATNQ